MSAAELTPLKGTFVNVAMMTSGGLAPCLSASIAQLVSAWIQALERGEITGVAFTFYLGGYKGLLTGTSVTITNEQAKAQIDTLNHLGGSPIGNSRVKVRTTNDNKEMGTAAHQDNDNHTK